MTTYEQITRIVHHSNSPNPLLSAIAKQLLHSFEDDTIIRNFLQDFHSSGLDEVDLMQLLGNEPHTFYTNNSDFFNSSKNNTDWIDLLRAKSMKTLEVLAQELDISLA